MEPNISWRPTGWAAARPSAQAICCSFKPEQFSGRGGGAEDAGRAGDVPADLVMRRRHRLADPALGLDADHQRTR